MEVVGSWCLSVSAGGQVVHYTDDKLAKRSVISRFRCGLKGIEVHSMRVKNIKSAKYKLICIAVQIGGVRFLLSAVNAKQFQNAARAKSFV